MSSEMNVTMGEVLRLTRAGRLSEATDVLQGRLTSMGTAAPSGSAVPLLHGDLSRLRFARAKPPHARTAGRSRGSRGSRTPASCHGPPCRSRR